MGVHEPHQAVRGVGKLVPQGQEEGEGERLVLEVFHGAGRLLPVHLVEEESLLEPRDLPPLPPRGP